MNSNEFVVHSKELKNQISLDTDSDIKALSSGTNPISLLFTSGKKKQAAGDSYKRISDYVESYIISDSKDTISKIEGLANISLESAFTDFNDFKQNYERLIKKLVVGTDSRPKISNVASLLSEYELLSNKIAKINSSVATDKETVKKSIEYLAAVELLNVLKGIPIDEATREKKGIRIKPLKEAGYENMADVYSASAYNLAAVHGISQDIAFTIKRIADGYAKNAAKGLKIKISYDNKTKAATDVVKKIYIYINKQKTLKEIKESQQKYSSFINQALDVLNEVGSGRFWAFYDDGYKKRIKDFYNNFGTIVYGEFGRAVKDSYDSYMSSNVSVNNDKAWDDFKANSIAYYNVIEDTERIYNGY